MAKLKGEFSFTGPLGNLSAYKRKDMDEVILRVKGGPTGTQIKNDPAFDITRRNNAEFGGRGTSSKYIRKAIQPVRNLANSNFTSQLVKLAGAFLLLDTESEFGKRNYEFTKNPQLFNGFNLNKGVLFDTIVRNPVHATISRDTISASADIPALLPGINFKVPGKHALFCIIASLGYLPDMAYNGNKYTPIGGHVTNTIVVEAATEWRPVHKRSPAARLELVLPLPTLSDNSSLLLSIGIRFGIVADANTVQQEPDAGAAKILMAV
jgi:hypothetical protein